METSVKERLKQFIDTLNISEREFCRRIGVSSSYVMSIKKSIQPDKMQAISIHFPELNPLWLLLGQGEMLLSDGKKEGEQRQNTGGLPSSELRITLIIRKFYKKHPEKYPLFTFPGVFCLFCCRNSRLTFYF